MKVFIRSSTPWHFHKWSSNVGCTNQYFKSDSISCWVSLTLILKFISLMLASSH